MSKKRASNCFTMAEVAALLRVCGAVDRRDVDTAQRYAQTPAAVKARGKLQRMRERLAGPESEPEPKERLVEVPFEAIPPRKEYVSRAQLRMREGQRRARERRAGEAAE
jgi:hypothetical protein